MLRARGKLRRNSKFKIENFKGQSGQAVRSGMQKSLAISRRRVRLSFTLSAFRRLAGPELGVESKKE